MLSSQLFKSPGPTVKLAEVTKRYRTAAEEVHALQQVGWEVEAGKAVSIMGPSGCGKTTLLNLVGGMDRPTSGKVFVDGRDLTASSERDLELYRLHKVGFVFQFYNLIPTLTALQNVQLPLAVAGRSDGFDRASELLRIVGLEGKALKRPEELSGGEQQRVAIAVALANDPALILADEPTGNLDSANAAIIANLLCSLAADFGKTVIMVSHDAKLTEQFPLSFTMRDGRFI